MSDERYQQLGEAYRDGVYEALSEKRAQAQRSRLAIDFALEQHLADKKPAFRWWPWALGTVMAASAALAILIWIGEPQPLECRTSTGIKVAAGEKLNARSDAISLAFADGSRLTLKKGGSLEAERLDSQEVSLTLSAGRLEAHVRPEAGRIWRYRAGPYWVRVLGTSLRITWDPAAQKLAVSVQAGSVSVRGGQLGPGGRKIARGQRLAVHNSQINLTEQRKKSPSIPIADADAPKNGALPEGQTTTSGGPKRRSPRLSRRWRTLFLQGHHKHAWRTTSSLGIARILRLGDAKDLLFLADLARLSRKQTTAIQALKAARRRFTGTPSAARAAYELGRIAAQRGDHAQAVQLLKRYLAEMPRRAISSNALGRLMASLRSLGRREEAKKRARRYLKRWPRGAYAGLARTIISE